MVPEPSAPPANGSRSPQRPLDGLLVIDVSQFAVGPYAGMLLGAAGAEVIKVEPPTGDPMLQLAPRHQGINSLYLGANFNKRSIILDLRTQPGMAALLSMVAKADIFLANWRPAGLERLGLTYAALQPSNPRLVYANCSGYGSRGPRRDLGSVDPWGQAVSGLASLNGDGDGPGEIDRSVIPGDFTAAMFLFQAVLAALFARERTGEGQEVETSQLIACLSVATTRAAEFTQAGRAPSALGSENPWSVPSACYPTADGYLAVSCDTDDQWQRLAAALDLGELGARAATAEDRRRLRAEINAAVGARLGELSAREWEARLDAVAVPCSRFRTKAEFSRLVRSAGDRYVVEARLPVGPLRLARPAWRFRDWEARMDPGPAWPGEHSREVGEAYGEAAATVEWVGTATTPL
jgi:crotonobetainyl-CoA:carnitine CoA-transferase CaiB-like acyl-CoA transferase